MTQAEPIPDLQWGQGNWQDYVNNWREKDAEYIQARSILRYETPAKRDGGAGSITSPQPGQFVWIDNMGDPASTEMLTYRSKDGTWKMHKPLPQGLTSVEDSSKVVISHVAAGGKGILFNSASPYGLGVDIPLNVMNGVLAVDATGVAIKTGGATAKLTTSATALVSDKPISAPTMALTGTGDVLSAAGKSVRVGTLTADVGAITNINLSGTLTGGTVNGASGTIGGVNFAGNRVKATAGLVDQEAVFYGDTAGAVIRGGVTTTNTYGSGVYIRVDTAAATISGGGYFDIYNQMRIRNNDVYWLDAGGTVRGYLGIVVVSGANQSASAWPNGTIWITP